MPTNNPIWDPEQHLGARTAEDSAPGDVVAGARPARQTQTNPSLTPNNQHPASLEAPESAPEEHKTYADSDHKKNEPIRSDLDGISVDNRLLEDGQFVAGGVLDDSDAVAQRNAELIRSKHEQEYANAIQAGRGDGPNPTDVHTHFTGGELVGQAELDAKVKPLSSAELTGALEAKRKADAPLAENDAEVARKEKEAADAVEAERVAEEERVEAEAAAERAKAEAESAAAVQPPDEEYHEEQR